MITKDDLVEILDSYLGRDVNKTFEPIADKILAEIKSDWEWEGLVDDGANENCDESASLME